MPGGKLILATENQEEFCFVVYITELETIVCVHAFIDDVVVTFGRKIPALPDNLAKA